MRLLSYSPVFPAASRAKIPPRCKAPYYFELAANKTRPAWSRAPGCFHITGGALRCRTQFRRVINVLAKSRGFGLAFWPFSPWRLSSRRLSFGWLGGTGRCLSRAGFLRNARGELFIGPKSRDRGDYQGLFIAEP